MMTKSGNETLTTLVRRLSDKGLCVVLMTEGINCRAKLVQVSLPVDPSLGVMPSDPRKVEVLAERLIAFGESYKRVAAEWEGQYGKLPVVSLLTMRDKWSWMPLGPAHANVPLASFAPII